MKVAEILKKMMAFSDGNIHDIDHFLEVWAMAKTIGELEGLDKHTREVLELAAVVHDIACPLCREKYGNTNGKNQELESPSLVEEFLMDSLLIMEIWSAFYGWWPTIIPIRTLMGWITKSCWRQIF